jgi:hypothetical protein
MHEAGMIVTGYDARVPVVLDALHEAAGAIADADDADPDLGHDRFPYPSLPTLQPNEKASKMVAVITRGVMVVKGPSADASSRPSLFLPKP